MSQGLNAIISLQKESSDILWLLIPIFMGIKVLFTLFDNSDIFSFFRVIKSTMVSILCLLLIDNLFEPIAKEVFSLATIENVNFRSESMVSFINSLVNYVLSVIAALLTALMTILISAFLAIVGIGLAPAYAAKGIVGFSGAWKMILKIILTLVVWSFLQMTFTKLGPGDSVGGAYFIGAIVSNALSFILISVCFKTNLASAALDKITNSGPGAKVKEAYKDSIKNGLASGFLKVDETTGRASAKGFDFNKEAVNEFQDSLFASKAVAGKSLMEIKNEDKLPKFTEKQKELEDQNNQEINNMIATGRASSVQEAKSLMNNKGLGASIDSNKSYKDKRIASVIKEKGYEKIGDAKAYLESPESQKELARNISVKTERATNMVEKGEANSINEAKQFIETPKLKDALNSNKDIQDRKTYKTIAQNRLNNMSEAKLLIESPKSFEALKETRELNEEKRNSKYLKEYKKSNEYKPGER